MEQNQQDGESEAAQQKWAQEVARYHHIGLTNRRYRDLTGEKYLLHIDGEGDAQWATIYRGERISIPRRHSSGPRVQENLMRPIVDNAVAYHTTQPFELIVEAKLDRAARERAQVEQAWINGLVEEQRWNDVFAEAMYLAMPYGWCPVHQFWREDVDDDLFEAIGGVEANQLRELMGARGFIDAFAGNPWDTVFSAGSTRTSYHRASYGRIVPAQMVRDAFQHIPRAQQLEGSDKIPSAAVYQRIARRWLQTNMALHGTSVVHSGESADELLALLYHELPPGVDPEWPEGRLTVVALDGAASTDREDSSGSGSFHNVVPLHDGKLPGGDFSFRGVYSSNRVDDVLGRPFVTDLDRLQLQLNQLLSARRDYVRRSVRAPLVTAGMIHDDTAVYENDAQMEVDPMTQFQPFYLELPAKHIPLLNTDIVETREAMFRIGGWQAASRGEGQAGDPASKTVALAKYDDQVHGPAHLRFREAVEASAEFAWKLMKEFGDVAWIVNATGDELAHLAELQVARDDLSDRPPRFKLVSGFGATPEARGQQLLNLYGLSDSQGREVLDTPTLRKLWPDNTLFADTDYVEQVRKRRAKVINSEIERAAISFREQTGFDGTSYADPWVQQAAQLVFVKLDEEFPLLMDDDLEAHLSALALLTQDETADALVRHVAAFRQGLYFQWQAMQMAGMGGPPPDVQPDQAQGTGAEGRNVQQAAQPGGTTTSEQIRSAEGEVPALTKQAQMGG